MRVLKRETDSKGRALDARIEEVKDTLPWVKQMLELGVSFEQFFERESRWVATNL